MIRSAEFSDIPVIAELMATAFWDDDAFRRYFKGFAGVDRAVGAEERRQALAPIFARQLEVEYVPEGVVDVFEDDGEILGAASWNSPFEGGGFNFGSYVRMYGAHSFRMAIRDAYSKRYHPAEPHWYLYTIVVSPDAQGRGIGSQLLGHGLQRADDSGHGVYLEATTPGSQRLYERLGFEVKAEIPTPDAWANEVGMFRPTL